MNLKSLLLRGVLLLTLAASLAGCGFKLRGQAQLPFESAYVEGSAKAGGDAAAQPASLASALRQALRAANKLAETPKDAAVRIALSDESLKKEILALSGGGKVREYRLSYKVTLAVADAAGNELLAPSEIHLNRDFSFSDAEVLAKEAEEATLARGMEQEALRQVMRRLAYLKR